jgi:hypothetical protein
VSPSEWEESLVAGPVKKKRRNPHKSGVTEPAEIHLSLNNFDKISAIICGQTRHRFLDIFVRDHLLVQYDPALRASIFEVSGKRLRTQLELG